MLPNSKKHKEFLKMTNKNKLLLAIFLFLTIAAIALAEVRINFKNQENGDQKQKFSYHYYDDSLSYVDGTDNVTFSAYFMKDVKDNGNVRKVLSSLTEIGKSDTLYMQVNVRNEGYLKNGKIQINGKNFYLATNLYKDNEFKDNYIGINTNEIEFNNLPNGTSKDIEAEIRSGDYSLNSTMRDAIGTDEDNMINYENTIVFTGTYVDGEGNEIEINKEYKLNVGWYGDVTAAIKNTNQVYSNLSEMVDEENDCVRLRFKVTTEEVNKQLTLENNETKIYIPKFNGYSATNAKCLSSVDHSYYYEVPELSGPRSLNNAGGLLIISRSAKITDEGEIGTQKKFLSKLASINVYEIEIEYPLEAYKNMNTNVASLIFNVSTNYTGCNSRTGYENSGDIISETVYANVNVTYEDIQTIDESDIGIEVGKNGVPKQRILAAYKGIVSTNNYLEYNTTWKASVDKSGLNKKIIIHDDSKSDEFIKEDSSAESMEDFLVYDGVIVTNAERVLGEDGWINVYDSETNDLIANLTKDDWENDNYYETSPRHIRIETSDVVSVDMPLYISNIKSVNVKSVVEKYSELDFKQFTKISSTVAGNIGDKTISVKVGTADFSAPTATMNVDLSEKNISADGNEKNFKLSIESDNDYYMNKEALINAGYVIKLPKEFKNITINDANIDNNYVYLGTSGVYEKDGYTYIRLTVINPDSSMGESYTLNIDMNVIAVSDKTTDSSIEVYYTTEGIGEYESVAVDGYDANNNLDFNEYVGKKNIDVKINYDAGVIITQKVNNIDDSTVVEVAPKYGDKEKNVSINVGVKNNEKSDITGVKVIGRIPTEGNKYVVSGQDMKSEYSTRLVNDGIVVPDDLKDKVTVYYSENVNANVETINSDNGWVTSDKVENWDNIKSFLIDFENTSIQSNETYLFEYEVSVPGVDYLNKTSYAGVSVYYTKNVNDEKQKSQADGYKLGIKLAEKIDVDLVKYKKDTAITVPGSTYDFYNGARDYIVTTDENGEANLEIYAGIHYYVYEIFANDEYEVNDDDAELKIDVDENGKLQLADVSTDKIFDFDEENKKLKVSVEDELKGKLEINLVDKDTKLPISNAEFKINDRYYKTDDNGQLVAKGLFADTSYTITEVSANGYQVLNDIKFKITVKDGAYSFEKQTDNIKDSSVNNVNGLVAHIDLENEKAKTFDLQITAIGETDDISDESTYTYLPNVEFGLYEEGRLIGTYTTDENGKLTIPNLYERIEGQSNGYEYVLSERIVPDGYSKLENMRIYAKRDDSGNLTFYGNGREFYYEVDQNVVNLVLENYEYHKLINKDQDTGDAISGAKFVITDSNDKMAVKSNGTYWGQKENINGKELYVGTTDENGEILLDLPEGRYTVTQVYVEDKYDLADVSYQFYIGLKNIQLLEISPPSKDIILYSAIKEFNIDLSIDASDVSAAGSITNANEKVMYGAASVNEHKVIPNAGYEIVNVSINGINQENTLNDDGSYTLPIISNVTEDKKVVVKIVESNKKFTIKTIDAETKSPVEGVEIEMTEKLTGTMVNNGSDYFVRDESGDYIPTNGKTYCTSHGISDDKSNTVANSYIVIDLTNVKSNKKVVVHASCSSEYDYDYGYATITKSTTAPAYNTESGRFMYISGTVPEKNYTSQTLQAGETYYLHIGYRKDGSDDENDDQVVIKNISVVDAATGVSEFEKGITSALGKLENQLEYSNYEINIIKLPDEYTVDNEKIYVSHTADSNKEIVIELEKKKKVIVHHYIDGTTTKVADDEVIYGALNERYLAKAKIDQYAYELLKDSDGNYVLPDNYTGTFTDEVQEVTYYYTENKVEVIVNHYIEGTKTAVPLADGSSAETEKNEYDIGDEYETSAIPEDELDKHYRLVNVDGNAAGTVENEQIQVTYYYARPYQTLTVNTYAEDGKTPLEGAEFSVITKEEFENPVEIGEMKSVKEAHNNSAELDELQDQEDNIDVQAYIDTDQIFDSAYCFIKDGDRYISNNNVEDTTAFGYIRIDLTNAISKILTINAEMLGTPYMDKAYIYVGESEYGFYDRYEICENGAKDYKIELWSGYVYYIGFKYDRHSWPTPEYEGVFAINSMKLENMDTIVTDANGKVQISVPSNEYVLIEENAPRGYEKINDPIDVEVTKDSAAIQNVINEKASGRVIVHYYAEGTTDKIAEDKIITGKIGNYYDTESLSNLGNSYELAYVPNNKYGNIQIYDTEVIYYYKVKEFNLNITKTQKDSDIGLQGVKYEFINNGEISVYTTDENGKITISGLKQGTEYELLEVSVPEGYSLDRKKMQFKAVYEDDKLVCHVENNDLTVTSKIIYEDIPVVDLNVENEPLFELIKTSEDEVKLLPGAKFVIKELVEKDGKTVESDAVDYAGNLVGTEEEINGEMLRVVTTDENGKIAVALKVGKYKVTEVEAPKGYNIGSDNIQYFEITEDTIKDISFYESFYHDAMSGVDIDNGYVKLKDGSYISVGGFYDKLFIPGKRFDESGELVQVTVDGKDIILSGDNYSKSYLDGKSDGKAGYNPSYKSGDKIGYVMKINPEGKVEWAYTFGYGDYFHITDVIATCDGGFAIVGENQGNMEWCDNRLEINSYSSNDGSFVAKFSSDGYVEWEKNIGDHNAYVYNYQILEDNNGDYLVYGYTNNDITISNYDTVNGNEIKLVGGASYLIKMEKDIGDVYRAIAIPSECYGKIVKSGNDYLMHVIYDERELRKLGYDNSKDYDGTHYEECVLRVSNSGIIKSVVPYNYVDFSDDFEYVTEQTAKDGGRLIIGNIRENFTIPASATTSGKDINVKVFGKVTGVVLKTNMKGKIEWVRTLASDEAENMFLQVAATENNGCVVAGMFNGKLDVVYYDGDLPYVKTYETQENCINLIFLNYDSNGSLLNVDGSRIIRYVESDPTAKNTSVEGKFKEGVLSKYKIDFDVNSINDLGDGYFEVGLMGYEYSYASIGEDDTLADPPGYYSTGKLVRNIVYKAVETPAKVAEKQTIKMKNTAKVYTIKTRVEGDGGNITGEDQPIFEIVNQGEDSKKAIKIMPDKLHYIKKITVNGVEIEFEINEEDGTYILKGFTDMEEDKEIVVTFGILNAEVVVHHYKEGTTDRLHDDVILNGKEDDPYSAEPVQELLKKYDVVETPKNATGEFAATKIEVNYYYRLKPETINVTVKYVDKSTGNEIADSETITGHKGDEYTTTEKEIKGFKLKEIPENAKGTMTENLEVIYYYSRPAKVIVNYIDTDTGDDLAEPEIIEGYQDDEYTTKAKEFEYYKLAKEPQNAKGTMEVKVSKDEDGEEVIEDETIVNYYYTKQAFNLKIKKDVSSAIVNGVSNDMYNGLSKIEIARKAVNTTNIQVVYKITVINDGDLAGKGTIQEQIPAGMEFVRDESSEWKVDGKTATLETKELAAGEQAEYTVTMNWTKSSENIGTKRNTVKLINTENEAGFEEKDTKDNTAYADIVIAISTGANSYMNIAGGILLVMIALACGVYVVKKVED